MHAGKLIGQFRRAAGLSQRELAIRIDVARTYLAEVESCRRDPGLVLLRDVARELSLPVAILLVHEEGPGSEINAELRAIVTQLLQVRSQIKDGTEIEDRITQGT